MPAEDSSSNEVAVNYTITSPLRKTLRASIEKDEKEDDKISATFTISPPPKPNTNSISQLANRLEKGLDLESNVGQSNSVSATINVPLITNKNSLAMDISDKVKKTDPSPTSPPPPVNQRIPPIPQPRSLFDLDNATSVKLADKLQSEAKRCEANAISDGPLSDLTDPLPPSPIHHTIFGERRPSWRLKCDYTSKVNRSTILLLTNLLMLLMAQFGKHQKNSLLDQNFFYGFFVFIVTSSHETLWLSIG